MKIHGSLLKERKRSLLTDKSNKKISIIGIGESDMDLFLKVDRMPGRGEKVRAKEIGKLPGGIIGNFCSQAVKMGVSCGIVTAVLCEVNSYAKSLPEPLVLQEIRQFLLHINFSILIGCFSTSRSDPPSVFECIYELFLQIRYASSTVLP